MTALTQAATFLLLLSHSWAFQAISPQKRLRTTGSPLPSRRWAVQTSLSKLDELEAFLSEGGEVTTEAVSRRRIALPSRDDSLQTTVLASSAAIATPETLAETTAEAVEGTTTEGAEYDPYADALDSQLGKIQQYQEKSDGPTIESRFKQMDLQDIIITLILPSIATFAAGRWVYNRVSVRVVKAVDEKLDSFAREMIYHDGDFSEMQLCQADYTKQLLLLPNRRYAMLKRYLEAYAKKKTVSPQAIASISYVFAIFGLSEDEAAKVLVSLCQDMGTAKISSAGKLLFLGSRILKTSEGISGLVPIKNMIMGTYRDERVAETLVDTSQQAMAEAAYRTAVQAGGKNQKSLTVGWEVLGLDRASAEAIFKEEAKEGFVSMRESMYGNQAQRYDRKGRKVDASGKLVDPAEGADDDDDDDSDNAPVSNVYECGECGYTLFIADGRESKFFGEGFECPECGASKDKFNAREDLDD